MFLVGQLILFARVKIGWQIIISTAGRNIQAKTVRSLLSFSHYRFKQSIKYKAFEFSKRVVMSTTHTPAEQILFCSYSVHELIVIESVRVISLLRALVAMRIGSCASLSITQQCAIKNIGLQALSRENHGLAHAVTDPADQCVDHAYVQHQTDFSGGSC
ncbi:hypothetical protein CKO12_04855 [Chromatium okenii]|nr:hypothetical protein [Chromatium okenii]